MALNEVYANGESINYVVQSSVTSGDFVSLNGNIVGVAETDAALGSDGSYYATLRHVGVFTGTTSDAVALGEALYIAGGVSHGKALITDGSVEDFFVGYAIEAKGAVAGNVKVRINN